MGNNETFEDLMNDVNNTAKGYGYKNGIDGARFTQRSNEISLGAINKEKRFRKC